MYLVLSAFPLVSVNIGKLVYLMRAQTGFLNNTQIHFMPLGGLISRFTSMLTDLTGQQRHHAILYITPFCAAA